MNRERIYFSQLPQPVLGAHPEWVELYNQAWRLAAKHIRESRGRHYMDCAWNPNKNYQWVWDTCLISMYCRYGAGQYPGIQSLDNFYELQREDGYISMTYDLDTGEEPWPNRINPPLLAWAEWEYYRATGDDSRFKRVIPHIERLMAWIDANRRNRPHRRLRARDCPPDGRGGSVDEYQLYYFTDCGSAGMDDSPRTPRIEEAGQFFDWVDLSSQMVLSFRMLGRIHEVLGSTERSLYWEHRAVELGELINVELWCEKTRFYHDRSLPDKFVGHKTAAGFWPILAGICSPDRLSLLIEHLKDENEFNRPTPVPSLSADDGNYCAKGTYWVGGVWAPTNYMITRGLMLAGCANQAHEIAMKYVGAIARTFAGVQPHTLWECYSPEYDLPGLTAYTKERVRPDFVGWTGVGPIAMLIENILGIDINVPERRVNWTILLTEEHGVRRLPVGQGVWADFLCEERGSVEAAGKVCVRSDVDLLVNIQRGEQNIIMRVPAEGSRELTI